MKRYIALTFAVIFFVAAFTSCQKKFKDGEIYTDLNGDEYPIATDENGELSRNENGDLIVLQTDEKGKVVKDEDGNTVANYEKIDHALVIDNVIELDTFYVKIPNGWENNASYTDITVKKSNAADQVKIMFTEGASASDVNKKLENTRMVINSTKEKFPDAVVEEKGIKIGEEEAVPYYGSYIPVSASGEPFYLAYALLERPEGLYTFMLTAERNLSEDFEEFSEILNSVQFK